MKPKAIAVVGPTAVGKSALAVELALLFNGEIVSCDSMQVYRGMDIGTAKISADEARGVPHHMIDIAEPTDSYSCAQYAVQARAVTDDILSRGRLPIFCGGTGQYLDSVLTGNSFSDAGTDEELRARLSARDEDELWNELAEIDPAAANATHKNNKKRVVRALETYYLTGITKTEWDARSRIADKPYDALIIGLYCAEREQLYARINARVDKMMADGLEDEVRALTPDPATTAGVAIGYKELSAYFRGESTRDEAVENIKRASRRYAKRQMTWFKSEPGIKWLCSDGDFDSVKKAAADMVYEFLRGEENG